MKKKEKYTVLVYPVGRSSWKTVSKLTYLGNILWFMTVPATSVTCFNHFNQSSITNMQIKFLSILFLLHLQTAYSVTISIKVAPMMRV